MSDIEQAKKLKGTPIIFFDADKTLWQVISLDPTKDDWASRGDTRTFELTGESEVTRIEDGTKFRLKDGVEESLARLNLQGVIVGIISDNEYLDVQRVGELLDIWKYIDQGYTNIWLSIGTAKKNVMIGEVMQNQKLSPGTSILLVDDNVDYADQMSKAGHSFILSPKDTFPKDAIIEHYGLK